TTRIDQPILANAGPMISLLQLLGVLGHGTGADDLHDPIGCSFEFNKVVAFWRTNLAQGAAPERFPSREERFRFVGNLGFRVDDPRAVEEHSPLAFLSH